MKKILLFCLLFISAISCNKEAENTTSSPIAVTPNPFGDYFSIGVPDLGKEVSIRVLTGSDENIADFNVTQGWASFQVDMTKQPLGIYYIETIIGGETFIDPIIKAE